jgi:hypothetical protein
MRPRYSLLTMTMTNGIRYCAATAISSMRNWKE